ncbi:DinB family protein [Niabella insulamsoli]|uniref:DinB family protein n=1 Tax=Niabella insulamsoli TaxID=3144874 RepID=UPI0031FCEEB9
MVIQQQLAYDITDAFGELIQILSALNSDQLNTAPSADSWTVGQVAEHVMKSSSGIPDQNTSQANRPFDENLIIIRDIFENMDLKAKADPALWPSHPPHETEALIQALEQNKQALLPIALEKDLEALCLDMEFPTIGQLTRFEWLNFIVVHTRRHTRQVRHILQQIS